LVGKVAPTQGGAQWTDDAVIAIAQLGTPNGLAVKDVTQFVILFGDLALDNDVVLQEHALLQFETCR